MIAFLHKFGESNVAELRIHFQKSLIERGRKEAAAHRNLEEASAEVGRIAGYASANGAKKSAVYLTPCGDLHPYQEQNCLVLISAFRPRLEYSSKSTCKLQGNTSNTEGEHRLTCNPLQDQRWVLPSLSAFSLPDWNPGGIGDTYDPHPVGVRYDTGSGQWAVFNEDGASMPLSAAFNVLAF